MKRLSFMLAALLSPLVIFSQINEYPYYSRTYNPMGTNYYSSSILFGVLMSNQAYNWFGSNAEKNYNEAMLRDKAQYIMGLFLDYYDKQKKYPDPVTDGWHNVVGMNHYDLCQDGKAFVVNNQVTQYVVDDWEYKELKKPFSIGDCKSAVELVTKKKGDKIKQTAGLDLYFIDFIIDQKSGTTSPVAPGKASFWADWKINGGKISVYINGIYKGKLYPEYEEITPECGDENTMTFEYKSGPHEFKAINSRNVWRGTINIFPGECTLQVLSESNNTVSGYK
jgi:hypothetical protein